MRGIGLAGLVVAGASCSSDSSGPPPPPPPPTAIAVASGDAQSGAVGSMLAAPIAVKVTDAGGDGVAGVAVTFAVTAGGGTLAATAPVTTNAQGIASTTWTIGTAAGTLNNSAKATAAGLTGSPVTFQATGTPGTPVTIVTVSGDNQNALVSTAAAAPLVAEVRDGYGNPVGGASVIWTISGGGSAATGTVAADPFGRTSLVRTVGSTVSGYTTTASLPVGGSAFVNFVTLGTAVASGFNVRVVFLTPVTATQRTAFLDAAARWSSIVVTGFPPDTVTTGPQSCGGNTPAMDHVIITSVLIYATVAPIDGPGKILGGASPCWVRLPGLTSLVGDMTFDSADLPSLETNNLLKPVILHEMGHVLGFGTLWNCEPYFSPPDCVKPPLLVDAGTDSTHFVGADANNYYAAAGGLTAFPSLLPVPVENTGGPGTQDGHWRETVMTNELMTGYVALGASPLSAITIGSLADMGYDVSYVTAEAYTFSAPPIGAPSLAPSLPLRELPRTGPIRGIDRLGRIMRVR